METPKQPGLALDKKFILMRRKTKGRSSVRGSVFVDVEQLRRLKEIRRDKIENFIKKFEEQKSQKLSTQDIIESIYKNQRDQTELEINLATSRILLKKDQYTEFKKDVKQKMLRDELRRRQDHLQKKYQTEKYENLINDKEKEYLLDIEGQVLECQTIENQRYQEESRDTSISKKIEQKFDIIDMAIKQGINIKIDNSIKDSEYIVGICNNDKNAYLNYKKKNFLRNKDKVQLDIASRVNRLISIKKDESASKQKNRSWKKSTMNNNERDTLDHQNPLNSFDVDNNPQIYETKLQEHLSGFILLEDDQENEDDEIHDKNQEYSQQNQTYHIQEIKEDDEVNLIKKRKKLMSSQQNCYNKDNLQINVNRPKTNAAGLYRMNFLTQKRKDNPQQYSLFSNKDQVLSGVRLSGDNIEKSTNASTKYQNLTSNFRAQSQQKRRIINASSQSFQIERGGPYSNMNGKFSNISFNQLSKKSKVNASSEYSAANSPIVAQTKHYSSFMQAATMRNISENKQLKSAQEKPQTQYQQFRKQMLDRIRNKENVQQQLLESKQHFNLSVNPSFMSKRPHTQAKSTRSKRNNEFDQKSPLQLADLSDSSERNKSASKLQNDDYQLNPLHKHVKSQLKHLRKNCNSVLTNHRLDQHKISDVYNELRNFQTTRLNRHQVPQVLHMMPDSDPISKYHQLLIQEDIRESRFKEANQQIQGMDLVDILRPQTMTSMLNYRIQEKDDNKIEGVMVEGEFRQGINDPSRVAAQWEKVKGIKKIVGRKAIIDEFMKRVQNIKDSNFNFKQSSIQQKD
eukprot:403362320